MLVQFAYYSAFIKICKSQSLHLYCVIKLPDVILSCGPNNSRMSFSSPYPLQRGTWTVQMNLEIAFPKRSGQAGSHKTSLYSSDG